MSGEHSSTGGNRPQGSDYERSHDFNTTVEKAREQYRRGRNDFDEKHPVGKYLKRRGLWPLHEHERQILRAQHYEVIEGGEDDFSGYWLSAPLHGEEGEISAIQRASIDKNGRKVRVGDQNDRITIGVAYGASIRLKNVVGQDGILHVTEGLEDAMSVARMNPDSVVWAACGRRGMEEIELPPNATEIRICADNDEAGRESAQKLAMRCALMGKAVVIMASPEDGEDPNDAFLAQRPLVQILDSWTARIFEYAGMSRLPKAETETRLKQLAKRHGVSLASVRDELKDFIKVSRPRRIMVATGVGDSIAKAVELGYRFGREGILPGDMVNVLIALQRIGLTSRLDLFDMNLYLEAVKSQSPVVEIPGAPLHGMGGSVVLRDEMLPPLVAFIALREGVTFSATMIHSALMAMGHAARHHSMQDWLAAVGPWDRVKRIARVLKEVFGVLSTPLMEWGSSALFVGQALRILSPGAKVDVMPVIVGDSGLGKSTFVRDIAAGGPERFTDAKLNVEDPRQVLEQTLGKAVVEWAEMEGLRKADWESLKAFLTRTEDSGRLAYARTNTSVPRGFINVGTVNGMDFIRSQVGSRRFLPVVVPRRGNFAFLADNWNQIWAEAREAASKIIEAASGGRPELAVPPDLWGEMEALLSGHTRLSVYAETLAPFLEEFEDAVIKSKDVQQFLIGHNRPCPDRELGEAMKSLGFIRPDNAFEFGGERWRAWYRGEKPTKEDYADRLLRVRRSDAVGKPVFDYDKIRLKAGKDDPGGKNLPTVDRASEADATHHTPTPRRVIRRSRGGS